MSISSKVEVCSRLLRVFGQIGIFHIARGQCPLRRDHSGVSSAASRSGFLADQLVGALFGLNPADPQADRAAIGVN